VFRSSLPIEFLISKKFLDPNLGRSLVIAGDERPVEDDADLETDPDVHQAVEDDQTGKCKPVGSAVATAGCVLRVVGPKNP